MKMGGSLFPIEDDGEQWLGKLKHRQTVKITATAPRNSEFLRKFFGMMKACYNQWDAPVFVAKDGGIVSTSYDQFRKEVTIQAGHFERDVRPDGTPIKVAKSISFANMDQLEFERVYNDCLDVILNKFLTNWTREDMAQVLEQFWMEWK